MHYPPFAALASLLVRDRKLEHAIRWSRQIERFSDRLSRAASRSGPGGRAAGALKARVPLSISAEVSERAALNRVLVGCLAFCAEKEIPESAILLDVDALSMF